MRLQFWRRRTRTGRERALDAIAQARRHPLVSKRPDPTPGSANDLYWAQQAWLAGNSGQP